MSGKGFRVEIPVNIKRGRRTQKVLSGGAAWKDDDPVPRIARLLALAHRWEEMVRRGAVEDYAEIARMIHLSTARITQICNLTLLPPRMQESLLASSCSYRSSRSLRAVASQVIWPYTRSPLQWSTSE